MKEIICPSCGKLHTIDPTPESYVEMETTIINAFTEGTYCECCALIYEMTHINFDEAPSANTPYNS